MIKYKLCKGFNTVEIEFDSIVEVNQDELEVAYELLPEYVAKEVEVKEQPTEGQLKYAKSLGIDPTGMSKQELWAAISKKAKK